MSDSTFESDMIRLRQAAQSRAARRESAEDLKRKILNSRIPKNPCFTEEAELNGHWAGYLLGLIGRIIGWGFLVGIMLFVLWRSDPNYRAWIFSSKQVAVGTLMLTLVVCWLKAGQDKLRLRGWLISSVPIIAALYALQAVYF